MAELGHEEKLLPAMPKGCFVFSKPTFALGRANDGDAPLGAIQTRRWSPYVVA
jgi:hypothetical protein